MPLAQDIRGTVFQNGTAVLMARIVGPDGDPIVKADIDGLRYTIFPIDPHRPSTLTPVAGHDDEELVIADVWYDTLETGGLWTHDAEGYNFLHEIDISEYEAFSLAETDYQVRYEITPVAGQKCVFRFLLHAV